MDALCVHAGETKYVLSYPTFCPFFLSVQLSIERIEVVEDFAYCAFNDQPWDHTAGTGGSERWPQPPESDRPAPAARGSNDDNARNGYQQGGRNQPRRFRNSDAEDKFNKKCLKCGLKNQSNSDCRHKNQPQCRSCLFYGHEVYNSLNAR